MKIKSVATTHVSHSRENSPWSQSLFCLEDGEAALTEIHFLAFGSSNSAV
jgi:hypothetical protein